MGGFKQKKITSCNFSAVLLWPCSEKGWGRRCSLGGEGMVLVLFFDLFLLPSDNSWALAIDVKIPVSDNPGALGRGKGRLSQTEKLQVAHSAVMFSKSIKLMKIP